MELKSEQHANTIKDSQNHQVQEQCSEYAIQLPVLTDKRNYRQIQHREINIMKGAQSGKFAK